MIKISRKQLHRLIKLASMKTPLYGHESESTAYLVDSYPYGFTTRTQAKYWIEFKPGKGFRSMFQTLNPKTHRWNKPKASTYSLLGENMYLSSDGKVFTSSITELSSAEDILEFVKDFPKANFLHLKVFVPKKIAYLEKSMAGEAVWHINNQPKPYSDEDIGRMRKELEIWQEIKRKI